MKPVFQTRFGKQGNCLAACVASILEVELEVVDFSCSDHPPNNWFDLFNEKLAKIGYGLLELESRRIGYLPVTGHWIATGPSPRQDVFHSVVHYSDLNATQASPVPRTGLNWTPLASRMVHDPHPSGKGIADIVARSYLVRL